MTKRDFFGLFKQAWAQATTISIVESAWKKTGLYIFDPDIVLSQLQSKRPSTSGSNTSHSSGISTSDIRTVRRLYKRIGGPLPSHDLTKLSDLVERLAAENSILKAQVSGLKTAVFIEKGWRKRGKPVFQNIHTLDEGKARFWLPKKFQEARQISKD
jgi:hypothetical protein